jgi:hypothetical protein
MRSLPLLMLSLLLAGPALAKLPPPTDAEKSATALAASKTAWSDKVAAYQLCKAIDRTVDSYRVQTKAAGKEAPPPSTAATPACTDPGPYVAPEVAQGARPQEASGAHSPPATALGPPSSTATEAQLKAKK